MVQSEGGIINIAIISAFPVGHNAGMLSVDLAFDSFVNKIGLNAQIDYFSSDANYTVKSNNKEITWHKLNEVKPLYKYDKIIYWGDFLQWIGFGRNDWLKRQVGELASNTIEKYYRLFLLDKDDELYEKTILFGGSIYPLTSSDLLDTRYYNGLSQLIENSNLTLFRDIASAGFAQQLSNKENSFWGCDCAFLLETGAKTPGIKKSLVYSFGRSGQANAQHEFVNELAKKLHLEPINVKWFDSRVGLYSKIQTIKQASVIVTDIYHLSVTGLREDIPTLCVGQGNSYATSTVSDKKKEILFKQHFAEHYYVFLREILSSVNNVQARKKLLNRCCSVLAAKNELAIISTMLKKHIARTSDKLYAALR